MTAGPPEGEIRFDRDGRHRVLTATQWLPSAPEALWRFLGDCRHMNRVVPRFLRFRIVSGDFVPVAEGKTYDYRLRLRGVPIFWRTLITDVDYPHSFTDVQARGPYASFVHHHTFVACEGGTRVGDVIRYRPPGGLLAGLVNVMVARELRLLFETRHRRLRTLYEAYAGGGPDPADLL